MLRAVRLAAKVGVAIDPKTAAPIPKLASLDSERAAGAPVRRNAEAAAVRSRGGDAAEPARARPVARPAAAARRDPRAAARHPLHRGRARRHRRARARGQGACRRRSCSRRCCGTRCCSTWNGGEGARREAAAGAVRRDGPRARSAGGAHLDSAPLRSDDQGDLVAAAALRAARRSAAVPAARAPRFRAAYDFLDAARRARRGADGRSSTGGRASRTRRDAEREAMLQPRRGAQESAAARAAAAASGARTRRSAPPRRTPADG